ncbi:Protein CBG17258 [Caenorhabditis briggsae]|uniref:Protein CBG17258 n=1 Tax=Caenorhabditis briggsae TaxID=6238 RepID=A8XQG9_CAEBR|nr:Protein CBG17258 [Caenorhabditis briggsae]CAP34894.1 Protein CBG17258 [Caenorhabditis briggsae]
MNQPQSSGLRCSSCKSARTDACFCCDKSKFTDPRNGETTPSEVLFVEQGVKEFEKVVEGRNKNVEELSIEFESEIREAENAHDVHRNEFFRKLGETLAGLEPRLMCNDLHIEIRTPLDLLPIIGNISSENFTDLVISSNSDELFEMRDVVELPHWKQLIYLRFRWLSSLSLPDITHIPNAPFLIPSPNVEDIMSFVEACRESPNELSHTIMANTDIAPVAQQLKPLGTQYTIGGTIIGRIPRRFGGYIKYEISHFLWNWETVSL